MKETHMHTHIWWKRLMTLKNGEKKTLVNSADEFVEKAETTRNLSFITKSNSLRRTVKDKSQELADLKIKLNEKVQSLID